jgi:hypothetical protein
VAGGETPILPTAPTSPRAMPSISPEGLPPVVALLTESMRLYGEVLIEENALLRKHNTAAVGSLLGRKLAATRLYQERMEQTLRDKKVLENIPLEQRVRVHALAHALEEQAAQNAVLLRASMSGLDRVLEVINSTVRNERQREAPYSKGGRLESARGRRSVAIAFNATF